MVRRRIGLALWFVAGCVEIDEPRFRNPCDPRNGGICADAAPIAGDARVDLDAAPADGAPDARTADRGPADLDAADLGAADLGAADLGPCADGGCDPCRSSEDCAGFPDRGECIAGVCRPCDPLTGVGCPAATPYCRASDFTCLPAAPCAENAERACYEAAPATRGRGVCRDGRQQCVDGVWAPCADAVYPADEQCNVADDDCDDRLDEGIALPCYDHDPATLGVGVCAAGARVCADGALGACEGQVGPTAETCNGQDDDCDGRVDQFAETCFGGDPAVIDIGRCRAGERACIAGDWTECRGEIEPRAEQCDRQDDDCDGALDEDFDVLTDRNHCGQCGRACGDAEECCQGRCRRLDTPEDCGECGNACDRGADRCELAPGGARCRCGDGDACPGDQRCVDGACRCQGNDDCGPQQLCCDGVCADTRAEPGPDGEPAQCAACGDGGCHPNVADHCDDRECRCGDSAECIGGTVCAPDDDGAYRCFGCERNSDCLQPGTICCDNACVPTDASFQCEGCGERCSPTAADRCVEVDRFAEPPVRCACGDDGAPCAGATPYCVDGACEECRNDADCPANRTRCFDGVCRECNPADHGPCGADQLCCDFRCRATGPAAGEQCEACGAGCNQLSTNRCTGRDCRCGNNPACGGATPVCDDARGICVTCRNDADCKGNPNGGQCVDNTCRACDPNGHDGCGGNQLCCARGGVPRCEVTGARLGDECEACDVACSQGPTSSCNARSCGCGNGPPCGGATPLCDDPRGVCVECLVDGHCNGRPGGSQCVNNACRPCDPGDHAGCGAEQLCCNFQCQATGGGPAAQCEACEQACGSSADTCHQRDCECGAGPACAGATPFCVAGGCKSCRNNNDCGANELCCNGACVPTGAEAPASCTVCGSSCNATNSNQCTNRACRCGNNNACGGNTPVCNDAANRCVQCLADGDCAGRAGTPECVGETCRQCDPATSVGCTENGAAPICEAANFTCRVCNNDAECVGRAGNLDECVGGRCRACDPATHAGCGGATPICDAASFACRACANNGECAGDTQCVGGACVGCDPANSGTCGVDLPICDAATTSCRSCRNDNECLARPGPEDQCVLGRCQVCDTADHAGCGLNQLCCDFQCVATGATPADACQACGVPCDVDSTNTCTHRACRCGNNAPCSGQTAFCDDARGVCVNCRSDADCGGARAQCVANVCQACDPADGAGCVASSDAPVCAGATPTCRACAADIECAGNANGTQCLPDGRCRTCDPADAAGCVEAGPSAICDVANAVCRACANDAECAARPGNLDQCVDGFCKACDATNGAGCNAAGATPVCDAVTSTCRACGSDADCNGNPNGNQCVAGACKACDPTDYAGCGAASATPVCSAAGVCVACANDAQCVPVAGNLDQCVGGRCRTCDANDHAGCSEVSQTPICGAVDFTCRACQNNNECSARPGNRDVCFLGSCHRCVRDLGRGCVAQVCNAQEQCVPCAGNADCEFHENGEVCVGGLCVECGVHADCNGELCTDNICRICMNNAECVAAGIGTTCVAGRCQ